MSLISFDSSIWAKKSFVVTHGTVAFHDFLKTTGPDTLVLGTNIGIVRGTLWVTDPDARRLHQLGAVFAKKRGKRRRRTDVPFSRTLKGIPLRSEPEFVGERKRLCRIWQGLNRPDVPVKVAQRSKGWLNGTGKDVVLMPTMVSLETDVCCDPASCDPDLLLNWAGAVCLGALDGDMEFLDEEETVKRRVLSVTVKDGLFSGDDVVALIVEAQQSLSNKEWCYVVVRAQSSAIQSARSVVGVLVTKTSVTRIKRSMVCVY